MISEVRVEGLTKLRGAIRQIGDRDLARALREANLAGAERVVVAALPQVPTLTGALKASVRALGSQVSGRAVAGSTGMKAQHSVPYAAAIHWGTGPRTGLPGPHNIRRRPFLWDAAELHRREIADEYAKRIDRILDAIRS